MAIKQAAWASTLAFALAFALAAEASAQDLCTHRIDGLGLAATKSEIAAVFSGRGWFDTSKPLHQGFETDYWRNQPPRNDPHGALPGSLGKLPPLETFGMARVQGAGRTITRQYAGAALERGRELCATYAALTHSGCDRLDAYGAGLRFEGKGDDGAACRLTLSGGHGSPWSEVLDRAPPGDDPKAGPSGRSRSRGGA